MWAPSPIALHSPIERFHGIAMLTVGYTWTSRPTVAPNMRKRTRRKANITRGLNRKAGHTAAHNVRRMRSTARYFFARRFDSISSSATVMSHRPNEWRWIAAAEKPLVRRTHFRADAAPAESFFGHRPTARSHGDPLRIIEGRRHGERRGERGGRRLDPPAAPPRLQLFPRCRPSRDHRNSARQRFHHHGAEVFTITRQQE